LFVTVIRVFFDRHLRKLFTITVSLVDGCACLTVSIGNQTVAQPIDARLSADVPLYASRIMYVELVPFQRNDGTACLTFSIKNRTVALCIDVPLCASRIIRAPRSDL